MSVQVLIFSRDRAMQLDAVLRSFYLHCQDSVQARLHVIFRASNEKHTQQYKVLHLLYPEVIFIEEQNLHYDILRIFSQHLSNYSIKCFFRLLTTANFFYYYPKGEMLLARSMRYILLRWRKKLLQKYLFESLGGEYLLFLVDDNIFVRDFSLGRLVWALEEHPDALGVSLRLGTNIAYSYSNDRPLVFPEFIYLLNGMLKFNWVTSDGEFAYPLEISSSVFRAIDIVPLIAGLQFRNPNDLELQMANYAVRFGDKLPFLLSARQSLTFCNPINVVQTVVPNRSGQVFGFSGEHLAQLFDRGYRIQVEEYCGFVPESCHQEVELQFSRLSETR